jgi:hypothetical protein
MSGASPASDEMDSPEPRRSSYRGIPDTAGRRARAPLHAALRPCRSRSRVACHGFGSSFRHYSTRYEITVENPGGVTRGVSLLELDGTAAGAGISLADDGAMHRVRVVLG